MNYFQGIGVDDYVTGTEMLASYARIRTKFAKVRPPRPKPADLIQSESKRVTLTHNDSDKALARAIDRLASATHGLAAAISRHDEAMERQDSISTTEEPPEEIRRISIAKIQHVVARHYNVTRVDLLSQRRHKAVTVPRQVAMYLGKTMTLQSFPEIGRRFGNKDHTTVLHAVRKITALIETDQVLADAIEAIRAELVEGPQ